MSAQVTIDLDPETLQRIEREAAAHGVSVSTYILGVIQRHEIQLDQEAHTIPRGEFERILKETLNRDAELYRRLARGPGQ
jgi:hypothetical protein